MPTRTPKAQLSSYSLPICVPVPIGAFSTFVEFKPNAVSVNLPNPAFAHPPNCRFNANANKGHRFAILMTHVGALRASRSGAGQPGRYP